MGRGGRGGAVLPPLPNHLASEILCRLCVKTLLRLRCVATSWLSLVDSDAFVRAHLSRSKSTNAPYQMIRGKETWANNIFYFGKRDRAWLFKPDSMTLLACCDGLLLFEMPWYRERKRKWVFCVVNPAIRKVFDLPVMAYGVYGSVLRMGQIVFDRASGMYKVVVVYKWPDPDGELCSVFTLGVDRYWRTLPVPMDHGFHDHHREVWQFPTLHGALHWITPQAPGSTSTTHDGSNRNWGIKHVSAFRVEDESFHRIKGYRRVPPYGRGWPRRPCCFFHVLAEYRGSLCLLYLDYRDHTLESWLLKDYTKQTWIHLHNIRSEKILRTPRTNDRRLAARLIYFSIDGEIQVGVAGEFGHHRLSYNAHLGNLSKHLMQVVVPHELLPYPVVLGFFVESLVKCDFNKTSYGLPGHRHGHTFTNRFTYRDVHRDIVHFFAPIEEEEEEERERFPSTIRGLVLFAGSIILPPIAAAIFLGRR